jgi:PAS domain S-box-containing protein
MLDDEHDPPGELAQAQRDLEAARARIAALEAEVHALKQAAKQPPQDLNAWRLLDLLRGSCEVIDRRWRYLYVNEAATRFIGRAQEDILGQTFMECHPDLEGTTLMSILQFVMQERIDANTEYEVVGPEGSSQWFEVQIHSLPEGLFIRSLDITSRKLALEQLHASEARLRLFVRHAPAAIAMLDKNMRYMIVSDRWLSDYRLSETDVIGRSHYDVFPEIPDEFKAIHKRCLQGEAARSDGDPFLRMDGRVDWVRWEAQPWYTREGSVGGMFLMTEVITKQREAEAKLAFQADLLSRVHDAVLATDADYRITYWNPAAEEMFGWTAEEAIGRVTGELFQTVVPNSSRELEIARLLEIGSFDVEASYLCKDGTRIIGHSTGLVLRGPDDTFQGIVSSVRDVTKQRRMEAELRENEQWLRLSFEAAELGRWQHEVQTDLVRLDERARLQHGVDSDTVRYEDLLARVHPDDLEMLRKKISDAVHSDGIDSFNAEHRVVLPGGEIRWLSVSSRSISDGGQSEVPSYVVGTSQDITEQKLAMARIQTLSRTLSVLSDINQAIVRERDLGTLLRQACQIAIEKGDFLMAWIGMIDPVSHQAVPIASAGQAQELLDYYVIDLSEEAAATDPIGRPLLNGDRWVCNDLAAAETVPNRDKMLSYGFRACAIFPLWVAGTLRGVFGLYTSTAQFFDTDELRLLDEMAGDISFALEFAEQDTRRELAQEALRASEEKYRVLIESVDAAITTIDFSGRYLFVNEIAARPYGVPPSEIIGKFVHELFPPEEAAQLLADVRKGIQGNKAYWRETQATIAGHPRWLNNNVQPVRDATGTPYATLIYSADITDIKLAEDAIRASEERYRSLVESSDSVIAMFDADGYVLYGNDIAARSLGLTPETIIGKRMHDLFPPGVADRHLVAVQRVIHTGQGQVSETTSVVGGAVRWYRMSIQPVRDAKGKTISAMVNGIDITRVKESEDALRQAHDTLEQRVVERTAELQTTKDRIEAILNNSPDGILLLSSDLRIQQANTAFAALFGYTDDSWFEKPLDAFISPEDRARVTAFVARRDHNGAGQSIEVRIVHPDGIGFDAELSIGHVHGDGVVCLVRDITVRKAHERQLRFHAGVQESVWDAVISVDIDSRIQSWNSAAEQIYGWREKEVIGKVADDVLHTRYESEELANNLTAILLQAGGWRGEVTQKRKDGSDLYVRVSVTVLTDDHGTPIGAVTVNHDITASKAAEDALRSYATEVYDLYNNAPCGYHSLNSDGVYVQMNDTELRWLGYEREEVINKLAFSDLVTPQSLETFRTNFPIFKQRGWIKDLEFDLIRKDGSTMHVLVSATAITGDKGEYVMSRATVFDITDLKLAQESIRESEARYRMLAENATDVVFRIEATGRVSYVSPSCRAVLGYGPEQVLGQDALSFAHPGDMSLAYAEVESAAVEDRPSLSFTIRFRRADGGYIWLETVGKILRSEQTGEVLGYIASGRDVTARKQAIDALRKSEARFRMVIESATDYILLLDPSGLLRMANPTALRDLGYSRDDVLFEPAKRLFAPESWASLNETFPALFASGVYRHEEQLVRKDGTTVVADCSWSVVYDDMGAPQSVILVMRDITERKRAEEALRAALESERELGELKSRFVSMASHEFRTPLATILALSETLSAYRHKLADDQIDRRLEKIREQVGYLTDIMEDILQLARMQARREDFSPVLMDLDAFCRSIIDEFEHQPAMRHRLDYRCNADLHAIRLDRKLMRQVISNLISNAIKYSPERDTVGVTLDYADQELVISVHDEGIGIPETDLKHLFEPFHRASNVGTIAGTGLGLSIVKESVDLHGGRIVVESGDPGTTFTVIIPALIKGGSGDAEDPGH